MRFDMAGARWTPLTARPGPSWHGQCGGRLAGHGSARSSPGAAAPAGLDAVVKRCRVTGRARRADLWERAATRVRAWNAIAARRLVAGRARGSDLRLRRRADGLTGLGARKGPRGEHRGAEHHAADERKEFESRKHALPHLGSLLAGSQAGARVPMGTFTGHSGRPDFASH